MCENDAGDLLLWDSLPYAGSTRSLAWADFDDDGDLDLAASSEGANTANTVFANRGAGPTNTTMHVSITLRALAGIVFWGPPSDG